MDNQLDALKKHWKSLDSVNIVDTPCEEDYISRTLEGKSVGNRRKLLRFYRLLSIISGVYVVLGPAMLLPLGLFPLWGLVLLSVFFGVCMAMNIYMYNLIDDIDFARMPTLELLCRVRKAYRVHIRRNHTPCSDAHTDVGLLLCRTGHSLGRHSRRHSRRIDRMAQQSKGDSLSARDRIRGQIGLRIIRF